MQLLPAGIEWRRAGDRATGCRDRKPDGGPPIGGSIDNPRDFNAANSGWALTARHARPRVHCPSNVAAVFFFSDYLIRKLVTQSSDSSPTAEFAPSTSSLANILGGCAEFAASFSASLSKDEQLAGSRLGIATALYSALAAKDAPTAQHCLRVALRCAAVGKAMGIGGSELHRLEVAALLHDVGKIGIPDFVLTKPGPLDDTERHVMQQQLGIGLAILSKCCRSQEVLEIVRYANNRYDGQGEDRHQPRGDDLPLGARILAAVDAYDSMTTEHVYRAAMSNDRALAELSSMSGSQFDPQVVMIMTQLGTQIEAELLSSPEAWLSQMLGTSAEGLWGLNPLEESAPQHQRQQAWRFPQKLLDAMHDGVIFVDGARKIVLWNRGAERLTGHSRESVLNRTWSCNILDLRDQDGNLLREMECPIERVMTMGVQLLLRLTVTRNRQQRVVVDAHVVPVMDERQGCIGATMMLHDVSSELTLKKRVENLHEKATTDPLTGVHNRAEFDRAHAELTRASQELGATCSIIICDIDRFKQVNDVYGHQAGDDVLVTFARLLREMARSEDVVARFGGEEFVILCPDCDNPTATRRAEEIRREWARTTHAALSQKTVTSSFGVTEVQMGDTTETMLRRADRALYQAKNDGRNRVVQIGGGLIAEPKKKSANWLGWLRRSAPDSVLSRQLIANVPINLLVEKIKGFIADHGAEILAIEDNFLVLNMDGSGPSERMRRSNDRPMSMVVELSLRETERTRDDGSGRVAATTDTIVAVTIRPKRSRDRRRSVTDQAEQVFDSLRSYLIAEEYTD